MTIRNRIALHFTIVVASILVIYSSLIYYQSATYRREDYYERLKRKARTTARFLVNVKEIDNHLLKIIDMNTLTALVDEKVLVFDSQNRLIYSSVDDHIIKYPPQLLSRVRKEKVVQTVNGENEMVGILHTEGDSTFVVLASANDRYGKTKLQNLKNTIYWGLLLGVGSSVLLGIFFAGQALRPVGQLNRQISTINILNLTQKLEEGNRRDEIALLAINFNRVLQRLHLAFQQQQNFVSHASHELRTPLSALKSEIQLGLLHIHDPTLYQETLNNLLTDTNRLIELTNNLLFLARTFDTANSVPFSPIRIDEVLFAVQEQISINTPGFVVAIEYTTFPLTENDTLVLGNEELLKRVFSNLCQNACKYSTEHRACVWIEIDTTHILTKIIDKGIGIPPQDLEQIFEPFYRGSNALQYDGFGVGLSICKGIIELHQGTICVESILTQGSTFTVKLPRYFA